jgi:hypothetical protein
MVRHFSLFSNILIVGLLSMVTLSLFGVIHYVIKYEERNNDLFLAENIIQNHMMDLYRGNPLTWSELNTRVISETPTITCDYVMNTTEYKTMKLTVHCLIKSNTDVAKISVIEKFY